MEMDVMGNTQRNYCRQHTYQSLFLLTLRNIIFIVTSYAAQYIFGVIVGQGGTGPALLDPLAFFIGKVTPDRENLNDDDWGDTDEGDNNRLLSH